MPCARARATDVTKPFDLDELLLKVGKIAQAEDAQAGTRCAAHLRGAGQEDLDHREEPWHVDILDTVAELKDSDVNILLTGETGVGKSLIAKAIHFSGRRRQMPFLSTNCATFTEDLLASELFGYEKGAFTGAVAAKPGLVEIADTGTLFLDEIAEWPTNLQAKLLKVVEDGDFYRVGGTRPVVVDVRFIAATNQNVRRMIAQGRFREDLYYRLNVMEIAIPPLRERTEDIAPLAKFLLAKHLPKSRKKISGFTEEVMVFLRTLQLPRQRPGTREHHRAGDHPREGRPHRAGESAARDPHAADRHHRPGEDPADRRGRQRGHYYAEKVVKLLGGNRSKASEALGISRTSLWKILKEA